MNQQRLIASALALVVMAGVAQAEGTRSISAWPDSQGFARITSLGAGPSAEAIDFQDAADFYANHRTTSVQIENEDSTAANVLLYQFVKSGSVAASELTTPGTDGTVTDVFRLRGGKTISLDVQAVGVILQSGDHTNLVDVNVVWTH